MGKYHKNDVNVADIIQKCKQGIKKEITKNHINHALQLIGKAGSILYETNQYYLDEELEEDLQQIADILKPLHQEEYVADTILFYDGFGLNNRGLAQIYLKALTKIKYVVYVSYTQAEKRIPDIINILKDHKIIFLEKKSYVDIIQELSQVIETYAPSAFFFYSHPSDVVGTVILNAYNGKRYQINLTDHAFWLGAKAIDTCIEFRDYGANVSKQYRGLNNFVKIPFYPIVDYDKKFQGFPFDVGENKVVFSGGSLYKTLGKDNLYYKIIDYMLATHKNIIFWYAGNGDRSEMDKILSKYLQRAYLTEERSDLLQVLQHCSFYLSTYPVCGGLMFQYAAIAGKVPLTLKFGKETDGFLIKQTDLKIEFDTYDELISEMDQLAIDEEYAFKKGQIIQNAVISEDMFNKEVAKLFTGEISSFPISFSPIDTTDFRMTYKERISEDKINKLIAQKGNLVAFKYFPLRFIRGGILKVKDKLKR